MKPFAFSIVMILLGLMMPFESRGGDRWRVTLEVKNESGSEGEMKFVIRGKRFKGKYAVIAGSSSFTDPLRGKVTGRKISRTRARQTVRMTGKTLGEEFPETIGMKGTLIRKTRGRFVYQGKKMIRRYTVNYTGTDAPNATVEVVLYFDPELGADVTRWVTTDSSGRWEFPEKVVWRPGSKGEFLPR